MPDITKENEILKEIKNDPEIYVVLVAMGEKGEKLYPDVERILSPGVALCSYHGTFENYELTDDHEDDFHELINGDQLIVLFGDEVPSLLGDHVNFTGNLFSSGPKLARAIDSLINMLTAKFVSIDIDDVKKVTGQSITGMPQSIVEFKGKYDDFCSEITEYCLMIHIEGNITLDELNQMLEKVMTSTDDEKVDILVSADFNDEMPLQHCKVWGMVY